KKEFGLIDWTKPADYIERFVRAMQPWPTAYTFLHRPGKEPMRVIVNKVCIASWPEEIEHAPPGYAFRPLESGRHTSRLGVITGDGAAIEILELQPAGKKRLAAEEFLRGHAIDLFDRFGPEVLA